jgi:hypothetical protein
MSRTLRWTLSSYIVVLAACTPARLAPASAPMLDADFRLVEAAMAPTDTLSVSIEGPAALRNAGAARYTASVRNGSTTTTRYYYWWFVASCAKGKSGCAPTSYRALAEGEGRDTVTVSFGPVNAEKDLVVQVAEIDGRGRTGSSTEYVVEGPARRTLGGGDDGFGKPVCDWYAGTFYPHTGTYTDARTHRQWKRQFRRDYCGNRVSWMPPQ